MPSYIARWKEKECGTKKAYRVWKDADYARARYLKRNGEPMDVYRCRWCGWYHIGHNPKGKNGQQREAARRVRRRAGELHAEELD